MSHPDCVSWFVPSLGTYQEQGTCAFLISGTTKPIPWATLNKSLENWADIPIAPNPCQPSPPCPVTFLVLSCLILLPRGNPVTFHLLRKLLSGPFISSPNCSISDLSGGRYVFIFKNRNWRPFGIINFFVCRENPDNNCQDFPEVISLHILMTLMIYLCASLLLQLFTPIPRWNSCWIWVN